MGMSPPSLLVAAYDIGVGAVDFIRCTYNGCSLSIHIEKTEGRKPGKKEKKELKDEAKLDLQLQEIKKEVSGACS